MKSDVEKEFAYLLAKEIGNIIRKESYLVAKLGDKYEEYAAARAKTEAEAEEKRWPKQFRYMWKPGSYAEQFDDFGEYCKFCRENNYKIGV